MKWWRFVVIALALPVVMHAYMYIMFSKKRAYDQIRLGDTVAKVDDILERADVLCANYSLRLGLHSTRTDTCYFEDPWHVYRIVVRPQDGHVVYKYMTWNPPNLGVRPLGQRMTEWMLNSSHF